MTAPAKVALSAKPATFTQRVGTPSVWARCSSAPMPMSARPNRLARTATATTTAATAITSTVKYTVRFDGTPVSTRPTVPAYCFSPYVTTWRVSSLMPNVRTAKYVPRRCRIARPASPANTAATSAPPAITMGHGAAATVQALT